MRRGLRFTITGRLTRNPCVTDPSPPPPLPPSLAAAPLYASHLAASHPATGSFIMADEAREDGILTDRTFVICVWALLLCTLASPLLMRCALQRKVRGEQVANGGAPAPPDAGRHTDTEAPLCVYAVTADGVSERRSVNTSFSDDARSDASRSTPPRPLVTSSTV